MTAQMQPTVAEEVAFAAPGAMYVGLVPADTGVHQPKSAAANDAEALFDTDDRSSPAKRRLALIVGPRLQRARTLAGYGQQEAAPLLGYSTPAQLSQHEMGRRLAPMPVLITAARLYGTSTDYLLGESPEPDRDPDAGNRAAILRGVRKALDATAELVVAQVSHHERLAGSGAVHVRGLISASSRLQEAIATLMRLNSDAFEQMRGSATVVRANEELIDLILEAEQRLRRHDERDAELRAALAALHEQDVSLLDEDAI